MTPSPPPAPPTVPTPDQSRIAISNLGNQSTDRLFIGFNDLSKPLGQGRTASVHYSLNSGQGWDRFNNTSPAGKPVVIERGSPRSGQDGPAVPLAAAPGSDTVYAAFERWQGNLAPGTADKKAGIVVVKDGAAGANSFGDLGAGAATHQGRGVNVIGGSQTIPVPDSGPLPPPPPPPMPRTGLGTGTALGFQRLGSDLALAVSPADPNSVYIAYAELVNGVPEVQLAAPSMAAGHSPMPSPPHPAPRSRRSPWRRMAQSGCWIRCGPAATRLRTWVAT